MILELNVRESELLAAALSFMTDVVLKGRENLSDGYVIKVPDYIELGDLQRKIIDLQIREEDENR